MSANPFVIQFNQKQFIAAEAKRKEIILDAGTLLQSRGICDAAFRILSFNADPVQSLPEARYEKDKSYELWAKQINDYLSWQFSTQTELFLRGSGARNLISPFDQLTHLLTSHLQKHEVEEILNQWAQFSSHLPNLNPPKDIDWFALACSPVDIQKMYAIKSELQAWIQQEFPHHHTEVIVTKANPLNSNLLPFIIIKIGDEFDFVFGLQGCKPALCSLDDHALQLQGDRLVPVSIGENGKEKKRFWQSMLDATFGIVRTDEGQKYDFYSCLAVLQHKTNGLKLVEEGSDLKSAVEPFLFNAPIPLLSHAIVSRYQTHQVDPSRLVENTLAYASQDPDKKAQILKGIHKEDPAFGKREKNNVEDLLNSAPQFPKLSSKERLEILHCLHTHTADALLKDEKTLKDNLLVHAKNIKLYTKEEQQLIAPLFQLYLDQSQAYPKEKLLLHKMLLANHYHFNFASLYNTISDVNKFELNLFRDFVHTAISKNSPEVDLEEGIKKFSQLKRDANVRDVGSAQLKLEIFRIKNSIGLQRKNLPARLRILKQFLEKKQKLRKIPEALVDDWNSFEEKLKK